MSQCPTSCRGMRAKKLIFRTKLCGAEKMQSSQIWSKCERHYSEVTLELFNVLASLHRPGLWRLLANVSVKFNKRAEENKQKLLAKKGFLFPGTKMISQWVFPLHGFNSGKERQWRVLVSLYRTSCCGEESCCQVTCWQRHHACQWIIFELFDWFTKGQNENQMRLWKETSNMFSFF